MSSSIALSSLQRLSSRPSWACRLYQWCGRKHLPGSNSRPHFHSMVDRTGPRYTTQIEYGPPVINMSPNLFTNRQQCFPRIASANRMCLWFDKIMVTALGFQEKNCAALLLSGIFADAQFTRWSTQFTKRYCAMAELDFYWHSYEVIVSWFSMTKNAFCHYDPKANDTT